MKLRTLLLLLVTLPLVADVTPKLPEVSQLRLISAYQYALLAQTQLQAAQKQFDDAKAAFDAETASEIKANNLPEGTTFSINISAKQVTIILPEKPKVGEKKQ